jgi:hypothetical protein
MASKKFGYSTLLRPKHNDRDRISLVGETYVLLKIGNDSYNLNIEVDKLPFTQEILAAHKDVINGTGTNFFDIGECTEIKRDFSLEPSDILHLNYMLLLYSLRQATARHVWRQTMPNYFASYVREYVFASLTPHKLKMACLDASLKVGSPLKNINKIAGIFENYGFDRETSKLYCIAWLSGIMLDALNMIKESDSPFIVSVDALVDETNSVIESSNLQSLASHAANKKLLFIANSQRMDVSDLAQDLLERARSSFMLSRPFCGILHATNYARATVSTYTIRMITHFTKDSNSRLIGTVEGGHDNIFTVINDSHAAPFSEDDFLTGIDVRRALSRGCSEEEVLRQYLT